MGLLDVFNSDEGLLGLSLLSAAGPSAVPASLGQRMAGAAQSYRQQKSAEEERRMMQSYRQAQMQAMQETAEDRQVAREDRLLARQRAEEERKLLADLFPAPVSGTQAVSMAGGPTNAAAALQGTTPSVDPSVYQRLVARGVPVDRVKALAESPTWGLPEAARTIEGVDDQLRPVTWQVDKFGRKMGEPMLQWKAPVMVNQGDIISAVDPVSLTARGQFGVNMSPAERDSSARGWNSNGIAAQRLAWEQGQAQKPQFRDGAWVVPPTAENPNGSVVPTPLFAPAKGSPQALAASGKSSLEIIGQAKDLLGKATGSYAGTAADTVAQAFGVSTPGAQASAKLKALEASLILTMPRLEGPQSDKDTALYRQAAAQIGDSTVPAKTKRAALETIESINRRYAQPFAPVGPSSATPTQPWNPLTGRIEEIK